MSMHITRMQRTAFKAWGSIGSAMPFISQTHYQVAKEALPELIEFIKLSGPNGLCFKYINNLNKLNGLVFEGLKTLNSGHAQHDELAKEIWGDWGYRSHDLQGGYVHAKYDAQAKTIAFVFYGFSATFTLSSGGGDIDNDQFTKHDNGVWFSANAVARFKPIVSEISDILDSESASSIHYTDPETGEALTAHQVIIKPR